MTLDDLRVFNAVIEAESLSAVARELGCTQSAVSQHISRLERELAVVLLERGPKGVALTAVGRLLYQASSAGLGALEIAIREIRRVREGGAARLSISTGGTTVRHFMREAVARFRRLHPDVALHFEPANSTRRCLDAVTRRAADLAFVTVEGEIEGFEQRPVLEMPLMLLVRRDDPLAERKQIEIRELETLRYISLPEETASHHLIHHLLARRGIELSPSTRVDDFDTANVFVELGLGHAIVPAVQGHHFAAGGVVRALPIHRLPPVRVGWAARRFALLPAVAREFMEIFAEAATTALHDIPGLRRLREVKGSARAAGAAAR